PQREQYPRLSQPAGGARRLADASIAVFFFSSRRRHTRCLSDWSSDVCSSDLGATRVELHHAIQSLDELLVCREGRRLAGGLGPRSEERRVGKEWRSRGWWGQ